MTRPKLPPNFRLVSVLSAGREGEVLRVEHKGRALVLRIGSEVRAELEVLAAVRHPGLLGLEDFGHLPDGRAFVARPFVEGRSLAEVDWRDATADELFAGIGSMLEALEALHRAGFVHGDLKPSNVLLADDGRVLLVDFGLSRAVGSEQEPGGGVAGGSLFYAAPEVLVGGAPGPAADLFAVGVLVHELLVGQRAPAAEFYARFPREGFFEAAGSPAELLPEWARTWVSRMVATAPASRPASAAEALRDLAERLGQSPPELAPSVRPRVAALGGDPGREAWTHRVLDQLAGEEPSLWLRLPAGEEPGPVAQELALAAARRGLGLRQVDLGALARSSATALELDEALGRLAQDPGALLLVQPHADAWAERACDLAAGREDAALLVVAEGAPRGGRTWVELPLPELDPASLAGRLTNLLEGQPEDLEALAGALLRGSKTTAAVDAGLEQLVALGFLAPGERAPRLRPGAGAALDQAPGGLRAAPVASLGEAGLELLALAVVSAGPLSDADLATGEARSAAAELLRLGLLVRGAAGLVATPSARGALSARVSPGQLAAAHGAVLARLEAEGGPVLVRALHAVGAGVDPAAEALADGWAKLREAGAPERVLAAAVRLEADLELARKSLPPRALAERAFAELATGAVERAESALATLNHPGAAAEVRALGLRLRGRCAELRHREQEALELFVRARELDPAAAGEALVAQANLLHARGRDREVAELAAEGAAASPRQRDYLSSLVAMGWARTGRGPEAIVRLEG
ncbi:MAG: serine/threonine-protein kinase, partial [Planctomycetota bacterium]|nr:serine/threonine-protein kinase [Planctomycetota bacterium]